MIPNINTFFTYQDYYSPADTKKDQQKTDFAVESCAEYEIVMLKYKHIQFRDVKYFAHVVDIYL